jgi:hypothetical protein
MENRLWKIFIEDVISQYKSSELVTWSVDQFLEAYTMWLERGNLLKEG